MTKATQGVLAGNFVAERPTTLEERVQRLEPWKDAGGGDTLESIARRALKLPG